MNTQIIHEKQSMEYLQWSQIRSSSGTAGSFLKATDDLQKPKKYYKLSQYDTVNGIIGHECVNELIADRLLNILGYLIYYEKPRRFYIELPDDADPWETPLILSSCLKRGEKTISAYWSKVWVQQRIIPSDRQNLGRILKDNGLDSYDEFKLLTMTDGRCSQTGLLLHYGCFRKKPSGFYKKKKQKKDKKCIPFGKEYIPYIFSG